MSEQDEIQLCTFRLGDFRMALGVDDVQEVLREQRLTRVPLAKPCIRGLINLRGRIVMVADLRCLFGFNQRATGDPVINLIVRHEDRVISFLVDEVEDVVRLDRHRVQPPPPVLDDVAREFVTGTVQLSDHLLLVLDRSACVMAADRQPSLSI